MSAAAEPGPAPSPAPSGPLRAPSGPLRGFRIIELAGIGPGPYAAMLRWCWTWSAGPTCCLTRTAPGR